MFLLPISSTRSISLSTLFFTTVASFWLLGFVLAQDSIYKNMLRQIEKCEYAAQEKVWHSFSGQLPTPIQGGLAPLYPPSFLQTSSLHTPLLQDLEKFYIAN